MIIIIRLAADLDHVWSANLLAVKQRLLLERGTIYSVAEEVFDIIDRQERLGARGDNNYRFAFHHFLLLAPAKSNISVGRRLSNTRRRRTLPAASGSSSTGPWPLGASSSLFYRMPRPHS